MAFQSESIETDLELAETPQMDLVTQDVWEADEMELMDLETQDEWHATSAQDQDPISATQIQQLITQDVWATDDVSMSDDSDIELETDDEWNEDPADFYELGDPEEINLRGFKTVASTYPFNLRNIENAPNLHGLLPDVFDHAVDRVMHGAGDNDLVGAEFLHPQLARPVLLPFRRRNDVRGSHLLHVLERVMQSNEAIKLDDGQMQIRLVRVTPPSGKGHHSRQDVNHERLLHKKRCFIQIKNTDELCLARAVIVAKARLEHVSKPNDKKLLNRFKDLCKIDQPRHKMQLNAAKKLMKDAGLENHVGACGVPELEKIQNVVKDYQIKVFTSMTTGSIIFTGHPAAEVINLYLFDNHYTVITSMPAFFNNSYYCQKCNVAYGNKEKHICDDKCPCCLESPPCANLPYKELLTCSACNRLFRGQTCMDNHLKQEERKRKDKTILLPSICQRIQKCKACDKHIRGLKNVQEHKCYHFKCRICNEVVPIKEHLCFMQPLDKAKELVEPDIDEDDEDVDEENEDLGLGDVVGFDGDEEDEEKEERDKPVIKFVFYDFETRQETSKTSSVFGDVFVHEPNLCVAHVVCEDCMDASLGNCPKCGQNRHVFKGPTAAHDFCDFLFGLKHVTAFAHNAQGFDAHFIMKYLQKQNVEPKVITRGLKIICLKVGTVKLLDSYSFLSMPLSAMPKAFNQSELKKGYFPHLFNTDDNQDYVGPMPDAHFYSPATMSSAGRDAFYKWYNEQVGQEFDFQKEFLAYCESDVDILRRCSLKFRDLFMETTGLDPFAKCCTIAGACNRVFRTLYLKPKTIGIVPHGGYRRSEKQSIIAIKWLKWLSHSRNIFIRHARNDPNGELQIGKYKVDGFSGINKVYEFHGCWWHGCPTCMKKRGQMTADNIQTAAEAYKYTQKRTKELKQLGYVVEEMWECDFRKHTQDNPQMKAFVDSVKIELPLDPRDAFFGGRTNAVKLYHKAATSDDGRPLEHIKYMDVCSLYPTVNKYDEYPIGHPKILTENLATISKTERPYNGLIKATVLAPRGLYHPLLPFRDGGKLLFALCRACAQSRQKVPCQHADQDRMFTGTWVSQEFYKALDLGYTVVEVFEVWHYETVQHYDPANPDSALFAGYINSFMKLKQEADGWPAWVKSEADKAKYIADYLTREGIQLEASNIEKNPGLRQLAKIMLNSFWGKFGQRNNLTKIAYTTDPEKYFKLITDHTSIIHSIVFVTETMVAVQYTKEEDFVEVMGNTNVVLAAYTTANARLRLYSYIEKLDRRVLYFDTDSVIYVSTIGQDEYEVPTGSYLGDMTDELKGYGPGSYITEFVSGGPKNYGYLVHSTNNGLKHCVIKVKGFSLNYAASAVVNFKSLRKMVRRFVVNDVVDTVQVVQHQIGRQADHDIVTKTTAKKYRVVYDKRIVQKDFTSLPYGF